MIPQVRSQWYLSPWWVEVTGYTPKTRFVRYRRIGMEHEGRLSLARWKREARRG